ncbi:MAG: TSUP family transporter [Methylococcaceae bacterium]
MPPEIMLTIAVTSVIQSIFGAGVLLFGTPLLLLFGHEFVDVLIVLLPISLVINLLQIVQHHVHIDFAFYRKLVLLTLPPIAVFLFLVIHLPINIGLIIGPFLLLIALKEISTTIARIIDRMMRYETAYFIVVGVVHGLSSLGGSLLTAIVHHKNYEKDVARVTVAASYGTFAVVQLLTLWLFSQRQIDVPVYDNIVYLTVGMMVFLLTGAMFYAQIDREKYRRIFAVFLAFSGLVLILKSLG